MFEGVARHSRFGIALGKAAAKSAVKRNALKRTFFHIAEDVRNKLPRRDFLMMAGKGSGELIKDEQRKELEELFKRFAKW